MKTGRRIQAAKRSGLTVTEVVVIVFMFAVMAALILPAIQHTRGGRRPECQNNMKQLTLAVTNCAVMRNEGRLPQLYASYSFDPDGSSEAIPDTIRRSWAVSLLVELDQGQLKRAIDGFDADAATAISGTDFEWPSLKVLQCPQSSEQFGKKARLSYVANTGYIDSSVWHNSVLSMRHHALAYDWDGEAGITEHDKLLSHSTGVFWRPTTPKDHATESDVQGLSLDFIAAGDGQSNTLLFAENLQAGQWDRAENLWEISFGLKVDRTGPDADVGAVSAGPLELSRPLKHVADSLPGTHPDAAVGTVPRPSSSHGGVSIYGFADGSAKQISDQIDPLVYARLLTPNGQQHGQSVEGVENY
jgi:hypothetical protein